MVIFKKRIASIQSTCGRASEGCEANARLSDLTMLTAVQRGQYAISEFAHDKFAFHSGYKLVFFQVWGNFSVRNKTNC